jgi:hypothetical protein
LRLSLDLSRLRASSDLDTIIMKVSPLNPTNLAQAMLSSNELGGDHGVPGIARYRCPNAAVIQTVGIAAITMISTKMSDDASVA